MACHVYDLTYYKIMTIAIYMQFEDTKVQPIMWKKLNNTMFKHGFPKPNFKGFMVDNMQANWNVVIIVYDSWDANVKMVDKEHTCLFYWIQSLRMHTKKLIKFEFQDQHKAICHK
jgi:hypothetical protein